MSGNTTIEWSEKVWNFVRGCRRISPGCQNCYAEKIAARFCGEGLAYEGLAKMTEGGARWTGDLRFIREDLTVPLRWRKPSRVFVNSMSDLFHEGFVEHDGDPFHALGGSIHLGFAVMAAASQHTFQVLTKRADAMLRWFREIEHVASVRYHRGVPELLHRCAMSAIEAGEIPERFAYRFDGWRNWTWPLPNVWIGVSVEDQQRADERIPLLLDAPAAVRWISAEPLLGEVDISAYMPGPHCEACRIGTCTEDLISWVVVGGESGAGSREMQYGWARSLVGQCERAGVPCFVKQLGDAYSDPVNGVAGRLLDIPGVADRLVPMPRRLGSKGKEMHEWPDALRVRQYPEVRR